MQINRRHFIGSLIALAILPTHEVLADRKRRRRGKRRGHDDDHDYEYADRARRSGDIVPLRDVLDSVRKLYKGEIVGIEFEKEGGIWLYEIKMVSEDGQFLDIYVDAKSNKVLKVEGK